MTDTEARLREALASLLMHYRSAKIQLTDTSFDGLLEVKAARAALSALPPADSGCKNKGGTCACVKYCADAVPGTRVKEPPALPAPPPDVGVTEEEIARVLHAWLKWSRPFEECSEEVLTNFDEGARAVLAHIKSKRGGASS